MTLGPGAARRSQGDSPIPRLLQLGETGPTPSLNASDHSVRQHHGSFRFVLPVTNQYRLKVLAAIPRPLVRIGVVCLLSEALPDAEVLLASNGGQARALLSIHSPEIILADPMIASELTNSPMWGATPARLLLVSPRGHIGVGGIPSLDWACGHLSERASETDLIAFIRTAANCELPNVRACGQKPCSLKTTCVPLATGLSKRQEEVLSLISEGLLPQQIAGRLSISVKTVESYRGQIKQKFDMADSRMLCRYASLWREDSLVLPGVTGVTDTQLAESHLAANASAAKGGSNK